jgi:trimeric autotransporter adhesin
MKLRVCFVVVSFLSAIVGSVLAQTAAYRQTSASTQVPRLIKFSGVAKDDSGKPITGVVGIQFSLYKDQQAGAPLWIETQNIRADTAGHYTALLGSASADGVPLELFSAGEAQWLGIQIQGQPERSRVLLVSVPYALKAHEAETLSGRNISDFVLANDAKSQSNSANNNQTNSTGARSSSSPPPAGPTTFTGSNSTQIVGVTQSGSGVGLSATATTHAAVAGTITGATNTAVYGLASNTSAGSIAAGVTGQANTQMGPGVQGVTTSPKGFGVQGVSTNASGGTAVQGLNKATAGFSVGVDGETSSVANLSSGVNGFEGAHTGQVFGVNGSTASVTKGAAGVNGYEGATTGQVFGVAGGTGSNTNFAAGVSGTANATSGQVFGVAGSTNSTGTNAAGVSGFEGATTGQVFGVAGSTNSTGSGSAGISGFNGATTGKVFGVVGSTNSATNFSVGVSGFEGATTGQVVGVSGETNSTTNQATGVFGFEGATTGQVFGVSGGTNSATNGAAGVNGFANATSGTVYGVAGFSSSTTGVATLGQANANSGTPTGVLGSTVSPTGIGVFGLSSTASAGKGVQGQTESTSGGVAGMFVAHGGAGLILQGLSGSTFTNEFSVDAAGNGFYAGNLNVTGKLTKGSGSFKIDHPLDPANKYLSHSFVESPDMMNVYNGNATTDRRGLATVTLPDYFEALNQDFRYQLTVIGKFAQAIVAKKIAANRFVIRTSKPNVEVSWQVTGIRQDAYAKAYRIPVEEEKPPQEQGRYLHPELFGASPEQAVGYNGLTPTQAEIARAPSLTVSYAPLQ